MSRGISIAELASMVKGKLTGNANTKMKVTGTCAIDRYVENKVSFIRNRKYADAIANLQNAVILLPHHLVELCQRHPQNIYIMVEDVVKSMMDIQDYFYKGQFIMGQEEISATAKINKSAKIGGQVYIGENVYVGANTIIGDGAKIMPNCYICDNVVIGRGTYIYPDVYIYRNSTIGDDCIIHPGARIGTEGFRVEHDIDNQLVRKLLHVGRVVIGDRVEIGANCTIDRATFEDSATVLCDDVKVDNQVHIGHNAKTGARTTIAAQSCIGGSAKIGKDVWIGIGVTVSNGVTIGNRARVLLNAVVAYDVAEDEVVSGFYAMPHRRWKQVWKKLKEEM